MAGNSVISQPDMSLSILSAAQSVQNTPHKVLLVAQKTAAGTAVAGALNESIPNDGSEGALFGPRSMAAGAVRMFKRINQVSRLDVITLDDDGSAVDATGTITFAGTAAGSGTYSVTVGSRKNYKFDVAVAAGDTAAAIASAVAAAVTANTDVPVTAGAATGVVTLTAANGGTEGNFITIQVEGVVSGVTATVVGMSGGATNPTLTNVFDVIGDNRYQTIIWPGSFDVSEVKTLLDNRFNVNNAVLDGVAIATVTDGLADLKTLGNTHNSKSLIYFGYNEVADDDYAGSSMREINIEHSAAFAALRALRFVDGHDISSYVISGNGALDSFGGTAAASLPYFNTPFSVLPIVPAGKGFSSIEIGELGTAGVSTMGNNVAGNAVICGEVFTTYKTDSAGNPDTSFKFLNYVDTSSAVREYIINNMRSRFAQSRLTDGDLVEGRLMANEGVVRAFIKGRYVELSGSDFALTQAGSDAVKFFEANLNVSVDVADGEVTATMKTPLVTQFRTFIGTMQVAFNIRG